MEWSTLCSDSEDTANGALDDWDISFGIDCDLHNNTRVPSCDALVAAARSLTPFHLRTR